jgi:hypothetical protein
MLCEALQAELVVDLQKAEQILWRIPPPSSSPPDPKAATHNSLTVVLVDAGVFSAFML